MGLLRKRKKLMVGTEKMTQVLMIKNGICKDLHNIILESLFLFPIMTFFIFNHSHSDGLSQDEVSLCLSEVSSYDALV